MIREKDGMTGTEWQCVSLGDDFEQGAGTRARERLKWITEYEGLGKFYTDDIFNQVYFELDEDREMFLLRWS